MAIKRKYAGAGIALAACLASATGLLAGAISQPVAVGIAIIGIIFGRALARSDRSAETRQ